MAKVNRPIDRYRKAASWMLAAICAGTSFSALAANAPDYIATMAPYQVRALSGTYAPANGNISLESVVPTGGAKGNWCSGDPGTDKCGYGVILPWSGGAKALSGTKLWVLGGGHNNSANNGIYAFDFSGSSQPQGWSLVDISSVSIVPSSGTGAALYSDGRAASNHTADGVVYAHHNNMIYMFGGSVWDQAGGVDKYTWKYDVAANRWSLLQSMTWNPNGFAVSAYDPNSGKIMVITTGTGNNSLGFFRTSNDSWSSVKNQGAEIFEAGMAYRSTGPNTGEALLIGSGQYRVWTIDWSAETATLSNKSGGTPIRNAEIPGAVYDSVADRFWVFGGGQGSVGWGSIFEINPNNWSVTAHALAGDAIQVQPGLIGHYGRYVFFPQWRAIGTVADHDSPAYVIRLPGAVAQVPVSREPENLIVE